MIDGLDQSASIRSYDGAAGTFTLSWTPDADEYVQVDYQGR